MPSLVIGYVKHHWNNLSERDKAIIHRDVKEELTVGWVGIKRQMMHALRIAHAKDDERAYKETKWVKEAESQ